MELIKDVLYIKYNEKIYKIQNESLSHLCKTMRNTKKFYEIDLLTAILNKNRKGAYIDCGANIGNHSLFFAGECPSTHVYSFEPYNYTFDIIKYNIRENGFNNKVTVYNKAVGNKLCRLGIKQPPNIHNIGRIEVVNNGDEVDCTTIDNEFKDMKDPIVVIKLDVQGFEMKVLQGAIKTIDKYKPLLAIECTTTKERDNVDNFLSPLGYKKGNKYCATPTYIFET